jgi:putative NIF3 family GTP cyclohydrolase 1 type 2
VKGRTLAPDMQIKDLTELLDHWAPPSLQEGYDNCGLLTGSPHTPCHGVLCTLDVTAAVLQEARNHHCNLVVA